MARRRGDRGVRGAAFTGGYLYWRGRGAGAIATHLLSLAQTLLVAQVAVGLLLLADDRRAADQLHYAYGAMALGAALVPGSTRPSPGRDDCCGSPGRRRSPARSRSAPS